MPLHMNLLSDIAIERRGKHQLVGRSLGTKSTRKEVATTTADLSSVTIEPGEFYLNSHKCLSYYHRIRVPGKAIDAALADANGRFSFLIHGVCGLVQNENLWVPCQCSSDADSLSLAPRKTNTPWPDQRVDALRQLKYEIPARRAKGKFHRCAVE